MKFLNVQLFHLRHCIVNDWASLRIAPSSPRDEGGEVVVSSKHSPRHLHRRRRDLIHISIPTPPPHSASPHPAHTTQLTHPHDQTTAAHHCADESQLISSISPTNAHAATITQPPSGTELASSLAPPHLRVHRTPISLATPFASAQHRRVRPPVSAQQRRPNPPNSPIPCRHHATARNGAPSHGPRPAGGAHATGPRDWGWEC